MLASVSVQRFGAGGCRWCMPTGASDADADAALAARSAGASAASAVAVSTRDSTGGGVAP